VKILLALGVVVGVAAVVVLQTDAPVLWALLVAGAAGVVAGVVYAARDRLAAPDYTPTVTVTAAALPAGATRPVPAAPARASLPGRGGALARMAGGSLVAPPTAALPGVPGSPGAPVVGVVLHVAVPPQGTAPWRPQVPARVIGAVDVVAGEVVQGSGQGTRR
jgi:hypothetical protein